MLCIEIRLGSLGALNLTSRSIPLSLSCWPDHDRARLYDMARSTIVLQDARSLAAASHPCRHPVSDMSHFTWSSHQVHCAPLGNWESLSNTFLVGHKSSILKTCPSHRILSVFATVRMLGSPYSSASSWFILFLHAPCSNTPPKMVRTMRLRISLLMSLSEVTTVPR